MFRWHYFYTIQILFTDTSVFLLRHKCISQMNVGFDQIIPIECFDCIIDGIYYNKKKMPNKIMKSNGSELSLRHAHIYIHIENKWTEINTLQPNQNSLSSKTSSLSSVTAQERKKKQVTRNPSIFYMKCRPIRIYRTLIHKN